MPGRAVRRRADRADALALAVLGVHRVRGQVRRQVGAHRDRPDARAAAAVRDAEGLVQVEVRDVAAELARPGVAQQRVEVGAVDVHLTAVLVHDLAQLGDGVLVDAVRRRVGDHDRRPGRRRAPRTGARRSSRSTEPSSVAFTTTTRMPAITADAALVPWADDGIRHDVAVGVAVGAVVAADRQQPGELALRAGVGLDRDPVVAGDLGQPALEVGDQPAVAGGVLGRRERVQVGEAGQAHRLHLGGRVELHRARAERDHAAVERVVAGREPAQVAQHLGLAVVLVEHRVGEVVGACAAGPGQGVGRVVVRRGRGSAVDAERPQHRRHRGPGGRLGGRERHRVGVDQAQLEARGSRAAATTSAARPGTGTVRVSKKRSSGTVEARPRAARRRAGRRSGGCGARSRAARPARGRRRTSTRPRPAAPARCRCWRSPCRGGCAARGSAGRAGRPGGPRRRPRRRPGARAGAARGRRRRP